MPNDIANNMADTIHQLEKELKDLREENKVLISEFDRLIKERVKERGELLKKSEQIAEYKRLLKAAVEDMGEENFCAKVCKRDNFACRVSDTCDFKWRYADEAEKLLKED